MKQRLLILIFILSIFLPISYVEAGTVLGSHKYAWSDNIGYINFEDVLVNDDTLSGSAWSANSGFINFAPGAGGVFNDGVGNLSGSAWGEQLGWIDFDAVSINPTTGKFSGTATGVLVGTITFDCPNFCDVETDWREASSDTVSSFSNGGSSRRGLRIFPNTGDVVVIDANDALVPSISIPLFISGFSENIAIVSAAVAQKPALFDVVSEPVQVKVAPGELLPVPVKLSNFGGGERVDVLITYSIFTNTGEEVYSINETVAVETTASFVKIIQIPSDTVPGAYIARTSITYKGQVAAATAEFPFTVERKILGLFQSTFIAYGSVTFAMGVLLLLSVYAFIKRSHRGRFNPLDYSNIPRSKRIFYEILSDTITQMRLRVGDQAITIALNINGLKINKETGRILDITGPPAQIIAELVSEYEKVLGKKVSFALRSGK